MRPMLRLVLDTRRAAVVCVLGQLEAMRGDFEEARELYREAGAVYERLGLRLSRVGWTEVVAAVELLAERVVPMDHLGA